MFDVLEGFRFRDGFAFDFRGNESRTIKWDQRHPGQFQPARREGVRDDVRISPDAGAGRGSMKIDWIPAKAYVTDPRGDHQTYRFAPQFARDLASVNYALPRRLSDHNPITVDLPFK